MNVVTENETNRSFGQIREKWRKKKINWKKKSFCMKLLTAMCTLCVRGFYLDSIWNGGDTNSSFRFESFFRLSFYMRK